MRFCFIDEAGDSQPINSPTQNIQPLLVISGLIIDGSKIPLLTKEFIQLKKRYFPNKFSTLNHDLDILIKEIKGDELRKKIKTQNFSSSNIQSTFRFLDSIFSLLKKHDVKLVSSIWVKNFGQPLVDRSIYTLTTQQICIRFNHYLHENNDNGVVIADYRDPTKNRYVAHSIFTRKHQHKGDSLPRLYEVPTFGISDNHACLQIADILCTTLIFPMATQVFCDGIINNTFIHPNFELLRLKYKKRIRNLQYHFKNSDGIMYWGIRAKDPHRNKKAIDLFS